MPEAKALLLVEVKTRIVDVQDLHASLDRKARIVPPLVARERGWRPALVGKILVVAGTHANREQVGRHAATFNATFPARGRAARAWIREPADAFAGLWFMPNIESVDQTRLRRATRTQTRDA